MTDIRDGYSIDTAQPMMSQERDFLRREFDLSECNAEQSGSLAMSARGEVAGDAFPKCKDNSWGETKVKMGMRILADGTQARHLIVTYSNGTVSAKCESSQGFPRGIMPTSGSIAQCMYPYQTYDGVISYGSLKAERYSSPFGDRFGFYDLDVDNGCIPLMLGKIRFTNFNHSDPAEPVFAIPMECSQESDKVSHTVDLLGLESTFRSVFPSFFPSFDKANSSSVPALRGGVGENHTARNVAPHGKK